MKADEFLLPEEELEHIFDRPADHSDQSPTVRGFVFDPYPHGLETPTLVLVRRPTRSGQVPSHGHGGPRP